MAVPQPHDERGRDSTLRPHAATFDATATTDAASHFASRLARGAKTLSTFAAIAATAAAANSTTAAPATAYVGLAAGGAGVLTRTRARTRTRTRTQTRTLTLTRAVDSL